MKCIIFQNLVLGFLIFLVKDMIERVHIFVFVYVISLSGWIQECGWSLDRGVLAQKVFKTTKICLREAVELLNKRLVE